MTDDCVDCACISEQAYDDLCLHIERLEDGVNGALAALNQGHDKLAVSVLELALAWPKP